MQTCSICHQQSSDQALVCPGCQADLRAFSVSAVALKKMQENPRVKTVRLSVPDDACPVCRAAEGTYAKDAVPTLPIPGCSEPNGCTAFYEPVLNEIYP